eukprot:757628-Hanusia_phi.AAC.13
MVQGARGRGGRGGRVERGQWEQENQGGFGSTWKQGARECWDEEGEEGIFWAKNSLRRVRDVIKVYRMRSSGSLLFLCICPHAGLVGSRRIESLPGSLLCRQRIDILNAKGGTNGPTRASLPRLTCCIHSFGTMGRYTSARSFDDRSAEVQAAPTEEEKEEASKKDVLEVSVSFSLLMLKPAEP